MINLITKTIEKHLNEKQGQWAWFVLLWCTGLFTVLTMGAIIKWMMRV